MRSSTGVDMCGALRMFQCGLDRRFKYGGVIDGERNGMFVRFI